MAEWLNFRYFRNTALQLNLRRSLPQAKHSNCASPLFKNRFSLEIHANFRLVWDFFEKIQPDNANFESLPAFVLFMPYNGLFMVFRSNFDPWFVLRENLGRVQQFVLNGQRSQNTILIVYLFRHQRCFVRRLWRFLRNERYRAHVHHFHDKYGRCGVCPRIWPRSSCHHAYVIKWWNKAIYLENVLDRRFHEFFPDWLSPKKPRRTIHGVHVLPENNNRHVSMERFSWVSSIQFVERSDLLLKQRLANSNVLTVQIW